LKKSEPLHYAHGETAEPPLWQTVLRSNWTIPLALLLLWPLNWLVHDANVLDNYTRRIILLIGVSIIAAVSLQLINGTSGQFSLGHAGFMAVGAYLAAYPMKTYAAAGANPIGVLLFYVAMGLVIAIAGLILLAIFLLIRTSARIHTQLPTFVLLIVGVWFLWDISAAARVREGAPPAYLLWSRGIGLLSDLFDAIANRKINFPMSREAGRPICFLIVLIGGGACAAVAGLIVGLPTLRLRGDYLAIATLGFAEIIRVVINNSQPLGGATGLTGIPRLSTFAWIYGGVIVTTIVVWRIVNSAKGRTLIAVREDEIAAAAVGIDTTRYRVFAFLVGSFFAGVAGGLFAHLNTYLNPTEFGFLRSVEFVVMVTLGGLGSISGAIVTAAVLTLLPELLRGFSEWRMILYSLLLIVMMLVRPQGLLGSREIWPFGRRRAAASTKRGFSVLPPQPPSPTTEPGAPTNAAP
jgi:branched-chain amino acid transport system permease protein